MSRTAAAFLLLLCSAAACGGSDPTSSQPPAAGAPSPAPTPPPGTTPPATPPVAPPPSAGLPAPAIASVSPSSGAAAGGTLVTISGSGFVAGSTVTFGGVAATVSSLGATSLAVVAPAHGAGPVEVAVVNPDHQLASLPSGYTFVAPAPVVAALNVHGCPPAGGVLVGLAGSNLSDAAEVTFGGTPGTGLSYDPQSGLVTVTAPPSPLGPAADGFVDVVLTTLDGQTATVAGFHYGAPPAPTSFTPASGARGQPLTIAGSGFSADAAGPRAGLQVAFGGTLATITSRTATEIVVAIPKLNPGVYQVIVTNFDGQYAVAPGAFTAPGP